MLNCHVPGYRLTVCLFHTAYVVSLHTTSLYMQCQVTQSNLNNQLDSWLTSPHLNNCHAHHIKAKHQTNDCKRMLPHTGVPIGNSPSSVYVICCTACITSHVVLHRVYYITRCVTPRVLHHTLC